MLKESDFSFISDDGMEIHCYKWEVEEASCKGAVQIAHGMAEHASRYEEFAKKLNAAGYSVYANDHRGHGRSILKGDPQGYLGEGPAFMRLVDDMATLTGIIKEDHPDKPVFLFGHSMGSFASRRYIMKYPDNVDGVIICGSNGAQGGILNLGLALASIQRKIIGEKRPSKLLNAMAFGSYNAKFIPNRTLFDWLSSCDEEVDKYMEDEYCGAVFPASFFAEFFKTLKFLENRKNYHMIPKDLPMLIISGEDDPVGAMGQGVKKLYRHYKDCGVKDLSIRLYPGCRHEIVNDSCRDQVLQDVLDFIDRIGK